jgi:hypothetical protein
MQQPLELLEMVVAVAVAVAVAVVALKHHHEQELLELLLQNSKVLS